MGEPATPSLHNVDDFLAWEERQPECYEVVGGIIRLWPGQRQPRPDRGEHHPRDAWPASRHAAARARQQSEGSLGGGIHHVPDAFVRCGPHQGDATIADDPVLVVEVLSPSTEQHDLTRKRWAYQAIPSLRTVLFVDPDRPVVEILTREAGGAWRSHVVEGLETSLHLAGLEVALPMVEIYEGAELEPAASIAPAG
jgi:Uma2 family endonuclease